MMDREFKILVLVIPAYGHLNPMTSFINELGKNRNLKIVFPGNEADRKLIESTGARFVSMPMTVFGDRMKMNEMRNNFQMDLMMEQYMKVGYDVVPQLTELVQREHFDLIIYDFATTGGRWIKSRMQSLQAAGQLKCKMPEFVMFSPSFMCAKDMYPNKSEPPMFPIPKLGLFMVLKLIVIFFRYVLFCWRFGLKLENPAVFVYQREKLNICGIIPELQPRSHMFEKCLVFVGSCACKWAFTNVECKFQRIRMRVYFQKLKNSERARN